jgi:hypothetical protein
MTKARLHPSLLEFNGAMGDMVFKKRDEKVYVSNKPKRAGEPIKCTTSGRDLMKQLGQSSAVGWSGSHVLCVLRSGARLANDAGFGKSAKRIRIAC